MVHIYPRKHVHLCEIFLKKVLATREKLYWWLSLLIKKTFSKEIGFKSGYMACFFKRKKLVSRKTLYRWIGLVFNIETCYKRTSPKVGCFAGFCQHFCRPRVWAHTHGYHYSLFEIGTKTGLRTIAQCRKDRVLLSKQNNNSRIDFLTMIIDVLCIMVIW